MFAKLEAEIEANPHADNEFVRWYDSERRYFIRSLKRDDEKGIMARLDKVFRITLEQVEKNDTLPVARPIVDIEIPEEFQIVAPEPPQPDTTPNQYKMVITCLIIPISLKPTR